MFKYKSIHPSVRVRVFIVRGRARPGTFKTLSCSSKARLYASAAPRGEECGLLTQQRQWVFRTTVFFFIHYYFYYYIFRIHYYYYYFFISFLIDKAGWCKCDDLPPHTHTYNILYIIRYTLLYITIWYNIIIMRARRSIIRAPRALSLYIYILLRRLIWLSLNKKKYNIK